MKLETELCQFVDNRVYNYHLPIPKQSGDLFCEENNRRIICHFPSINKSIQTSLMPYPGGYFILINQKLLTELSVSAGDEVSIEIEKDTSEYGMPMPEELQAVLDQEVDAQRFFSELTDGKKRNLIYIVNKVKNTESRLNKALAIANHLIEVSGKLDFKLLNIAIKEFNQRGKLR